MQLSKTIIRVLAIAGGMFLTTAAHAQTTWYVDDDGDPANGCTGWADACPELHKALDLATPSAQAQITYTVTDLGPLGTRGSHHSAYAVNGRGQVVGCFDFWTGSPTEHHAFLWLPEADYGLEAGMNDLGPLGGEQSCAHDLNDAGQVVGYAYAPGASHSVGFMWENNVVTDLGGLGEYGSMAEGINQAGLVTGDSLIERSPSPELIIAHAFTYDPARGMQDIGSFQTWGGFNDIAVGTSINDAGKVVGYGPRTWDAECHAALWDENGIRDLSLGWPRPASKAMDINNEDEIVGSHWYAPAGLAGDHAVIWRPDESGDYVTNELGTVAGGTQSYALAINDLGNVVGWSNTAEGELSRHAFLWTKGEMYDLNDSIGAGSDWVLEEATDISNAGHIVGHGHYEGNSTRRAYLLTPDCNGNGVGDPQDIAEGTSKDCDGNSVPDECDRASYGDVNGDGEVDVDDLLCMLDGLRGLFTCPGVTFEDLDIHPCDLGNGDIDLYDLLNLLDALAGIPPCPDPCP